MSDKSGKDIWKLKKSRKEVNEQFGRKMNKDIGKNRNVWKEGNKVNGGKVESIMRVYVMGK